jgi:hypothetical protein
MTHEASAAASLPGSIVAGLSHVKIVLEQIMVSTG